MSVPVRIDRQTLTAVHAESGFRPSRTHSLTFERDDGLMVFHDPTPDDKFPWVHVVEDIDRAIAGQGVDEPLGDKFRENLFRMYGETGTTD